MDPQAPIPLTVIGGYLGAGKTTLLNRLLQGDHGRRIAVLVNDFGSINIDAELIAGQDGEIVSLTNGCVCCTLASGFVEALDAVAARRPRVEHVVIEASGVSDPAAIAQYGHVPPFALDGVIVLADAETVRSRARDRYVGSAVLRQLRGADLIVLTKVDRVAPGQVEALHAWIAQVAPGARVVAASHGALAPALLLDLGGAAHLTGQGHDDGHSAHETWSWESSVPISERALRVFLGALPHGVVRGKGVLWLRERPERRTILQLVGRRWELEPGPPWGDVPPGSRLVLIGVPGSIDARQLAETMWAVAG